MNLVFMDFDGTITTKDTFIEFIRFHKSFFTFYLGIFLLSPILVGYKLKLIPNWKTKELVFSYFFKGLDEKLLLKSGDKFAKEYLPKLVRKVAIDEIEKHKKNIAKIVVVTASFPIWIKPWCDKNGLDLIATQYEVKNRKITGHILGKNCYGKEKTRRINKVYDLSNADKIFAYGDSRGDIEMLNIADVKYMKWEEVTSLQSAVSSKHR